MSFNFNNLTPLRFGTVRWRWPDGARTLQISFLFRYLAGRATREFVEARPGTAQSVTNTRFSGGGSARLVFPPGAGRNPRISSRTRPAAGRARRGRDRADLLK